MDIHLDGVVADFLAPLTQTVYQLVLADQAAGPLQQYLQQTQLTGRQLDHLAVNRGHTPRLVVHQWAVFDGRARAAHAAACQRTHACFQLGQRKRFGHVIVGAQVQALNALFNRVGRRQNQHRHGITTPAQSFEHFQPVQPGQAQIQNQQIEFAIGQQRCVCLASGGDMADHGARAAQGSLQAISQHLVIFGNQYAHIVSLPLAPAGSCSFHRECLRHMVGVLIVGGASGLPCGHHTEIVDRS